MMTTHKSEKERDRQNGYRYTNQNQEIATGNQAGFSISSGSLGNKPMLKTRHKRAVEIKPKLGKDMTF